MCISLSATGALLVLFVVASVALSRPPPHDLRAQPEALGVEELPRRDQHFLDDSNDADDDADYSDEEDEIRQRLLQIFERSKVEPRADLALQYSAGALLTYGDSTLSCSPLQQVSCSCSPRFSLQYECSAIYPALLNPPQI